MGKLLNSLDADLRREVENVRAAATRIWKVPLHRYYTDHTVAHSERVITLLDGLTAGMMNTDRRLSPTEVYVLLAATYLHDIGMQNERFAGGDLDEIRARHNELTAEMIYEVFEQPEQAVAIPLVRDPTIVEAVALVARGHRQINLYSEDYDEFTFAGEPVRTRLLAALLRFGDELDIDYRRVDIEAMKLLKLPLESQLHWWKCYYVSGVRVDANEYIRIEYRFPQKMVDEYRRLIAPLVEGEVRARLAEVEEIFRTGAVKVALGASKTHAGRLVQPLSAEVAALARRKVTPDLPVQPEFWQHFAVILSFGKVVHKAFQALDFAYGSKLLERAEAIARHPTDETLLADCARIWQGFYQYYQGFTARELFEPAVKLSTWLQQTDAAFPYLRGSASTGASVEAAAQAVSAASGFYEEIKTLLADYPELVQDVEDVVGRPQASAASQWDRGRLRQTLIAAFDEPALRRLCATSGLIAYDELPGDTKAARVRALIAHFDRRERLPALIAASRAQRPDLAGLHELDATYPTQVTTKTRELIQMTRTLALDADSLIQNLVEIIVPKEGDH